MIIAIVGSRYGLAWHKVRVKVLELLRRPDIDGVVSGGAPGVDTIVEQCAAAVGKPCQIIRADWKKYGKRAGFLRNPQIVDAGAEVHAIWDGASRGTANTLAYARKTGKPVFAYEMAGGHCADIPIQRIGL